MARRLTRKILIFVAVAATVGMLTYAFWPQPVEVEWAEAVLGPLTVTVNEDGRTRIRERYVVSVPLTGNMERITLRPGDAVRKGETMLVSIQPQRPHMLDARESAEAEARVKAAQAAVARSQKTLNAAEAALEYASAELQRARSVARERVISRSELDNVEMLFRTRTEEFAAARHAQEIANFELELARAALAYSRPIEEGVSDSSVFQIHSPIDGSVLRLIRESAQVVLAGTALLEVGDPTDLEVEVDVLSSDAVRIRPGAQVWLEHWGGDHALEGRVRLVEPSGYTKVSALGVEEQRVNVIIDLVTPANERESLRDGFRVEARIVIWEAAQVLKVPTSTLFRQGPSWAVFLVQDDHAQLREVQIGQRGGLEVEVVSGLEPGSRVIMHPSDRLKPGITVTARERRAI